MEEAPVSATIPLVASQDSLIFLFNKKREQALGSETLAGNKI